MRKTTHTPGLAAKLGKTLLLIALSAGGALAQQVTDPSVTNPNYDSWKSQGAQEHLARVAAQQKNAALLPGAGAQKQAVQQTGAPAAEVVSDCFIPRDASYLPVPRNDDGSYGPIALGFNFDLYGTTYNQVWINTNGNLTFTQAYAEYTPSGFPFTLPMVAPFWADVDTRNPASGIAYYQLNPTNLIVTWENVGYFDQQVDKRNTFQVIIGTNADALTGLGQNVSFRYGDMNWTTGSFSGGVNGFGGSPATVGVNHGNNIDYVQVGRFNQNNSSFDGPGGNPDGVHYLDGQCFSFNVSSAGNIPPSVNGMPANNVINLACGETATISPTFLAPEVNQSVTVTVNTNNLCNTSVATTNGTTASAEVTITASACNSGTHQIVFTATDNGNPSETTTATVTVNIGTCCNLEATIAGINVDCHGAGNGGANLTVTNGTQPLSFDWSNGATSEDLADLEPGTYTVTVTDGNGCTDEASVTITQPPFVTPTANPDQFTAPACESITFSAADLIGNDTDPQGDDLELADVMQPSSGTITDNGNGTYTFTPAPGTSGPVTFTYVVKKDDPLVAYTGNGHFYEYVAAPAICWTDAKAAAEARTYFGMQGYLATITSAGENAFAASKLEGNGWIGGSDDVVEGVWRWKTGPEAGQQFWQGNAGGFALAYHNWNFFEPNNLGDEDYAHFYTGTGDWNDLINCQTSAWISGYVVEYGGLESCLPQLTATGTATIQVAAPDPVVVTLAAGTFGGGYNSSCNGFSNGSATASVTGGCLPYTYLWSNGQTSASATSLAAGTHSVTVTDAYGTSVQENITLTEPDPVTVSAEMSPAVAHPGAQPSTIYLGYGPQTRTLTATAGGGVPAYSFAWSPATDLNTATGQEVIASPDISTIYQVIATDANGCTAATTLPLQVIDARCGTNPNNPKVIVCHNGHEICISASAVLSHLNHGCTVGPCGSARQTDAAVNNEQALGFTAFPNPNSGNFTVEIWNTEGGTVALDLLDVNGRTVRKLFGGLLNADQKQQIEVAESNLPTGIYLIRLQAQNQVKILRVSIQP